MRDVLIKFASLRIHNPKSAQEKALQELANHNQYQVPVFSVQLKKSNPEREEGVNYKTKQQQQQY